MQSGLVDDRGLDQALADIFEVEFMPVTETSEKKTTVATPVVLASHLRLIRFFVISHAKKQVLAAQDIRNRDLPHRRSCSAHVKRPFNLDMLSTETCQHSQRQ